MIIFDFDALANNAKKNKTITELAKKFKKHNVILAKELTEIGPIKRTAGMKYRDVTIVASDSQKVTLSVKETGDIFKVKIANERGIFKELPIKEQRDHDKAVGEIAKKMVALRVSFQKKLANKQKNELPKEMKDEVKQSLSSKRETEKSLAEQIADADREIARLDREIAEMKSKIASEGFEGATVH